MTHSSNGPSVSLNSTSDVCISFETGVVAVANVVPGARFKLACTSDDLANSKSVVRDHDWSNTLDLEPRRVALDGGGVEVFGDGDWVDGWRAALDALAESIYLEPRDGNPRSVAVVGSPFFRNEGDARGNVAEIKRLLVDGLDLDVVSMWPDGGDIAALGRAGRANTIISMPYGRCASSTIAARTGARVIEVGLPIGLGGTTDWLEELGEAFGVTDIVATFIESELDRVVPRFEWVVPHYLIHRKVFVLQDGPMASAIAKALDETGCDVMGVVTTGGLCECNQLTEFPDSADIWIASRPGIGMAMTRMAAVVEIGFPSSGTHYINNYGWLGYVGFAGLVETMINRISVRDILASWSKGIQRDHQSHHGQ